MAWKPLRVPMPLTIRVDEVGQGLAEYALILALVSVIAILSLLFLGGQISAILSTLGVSI
jgi:Flp pilus assembly pilin Flp